MWGGCLASCQPGPSSLSISPVSAAGFRHVRLFRDLPGGGADHWRDSRDARRNDLQGVKADARLSAAGVAAARPAENPQRATGSRNAGARASGVPGRVYRDRTPHLQRPVRETRRSRSRARNRSVARVWGWHGQLWAVRVDARASEGLEGERAALFRRRRPWPVPRPDGNRGRAARRTSLIRGEACAPTELRAGQYGMAAATAAERGGITGPVVTFPPGAFPRRLLAPKGGRQRICR